MNALWEDRYQELTARAVATLAADELEDLADAAFWTGRPREAIDARHRAYKMRRQDGDHQGAAQLAWRLFHGHFELNEVAAASGWLTRAQQHADRLDDSPERGYVEVAAAMWAAFSGDLDEALRHAILARQIGEESTDADLTAWGVAVHGGMLIASGEVDDGIAHLDDAMLDVSSDDLTPFVTGWIYCYLLKTCQAIGDVARAVEWTGTALRWCAENGADSWYPGVCRLHRCEVASLQGDWGEAEQEALRAADELQPFGDYLVAHGHYVVGEVRRLQGDLDGAESAFRRAHELGSDAQPGLGLLCLDRGDVTGAVAQLRHAAAAGARPPLTHARLLSAVVTAELAAGDTDAAGAAADGLHELAARTDRDLLVALALMSGADVALARDEVDEALPLLRDAGVICQRLDFPYEAAQVRVGLGEAARHRGDEQTARMHFAAAMAAFERLGARPAADRVRARIEERPDELPAGLSEREVEVLRLVAEGLSNRDVAERLFISEHTVRRHLSNSYTKIGVTSRAAATAFVFQHQLA